MRDDETTDHELNEPRPPYGDLARERWGGGQEARTTSDEALRPEAARPTPTRQGPRSGPRTKRDGGRARSARPQTNQTDLRAS